MAEISKQGYGFSGGCFETIDRVDSKVRSDFAKLEVVMRDNLVELLDNDIIYVQKFGSQTERSMFELIGRINRLSTELRAQNKRVLILSNAQEEGMMDEGAKKMAATIGANLDYDKSATYGASSQLIAVRKQMIKAAGLDQKVANFKTKKAALAWLLR